MSDKDLVSWDRVIDEKIANALLALNTVQPGIVESYNAADNTASVQPMIGITTVDDDGAPVVVDQPLLNNIPVLMPTVGQYAITLPVTAGTQGVILHCQRDIDSAVLSGSKGRAATYRVQHISDGLFLPFPISDASRAGAVAVDGLQIKAGGVTLTVKPTGVEVFGGDLNVMGTGFLTHTHAGNNVPPTPGS
jgi:hypothetical protein